MDAGLVGALIGIGVMGCGILTVVCYEKGRQLKQAWLRKYQSWKQANQPLLPTVKQNPVLVKRAQFQMKELLQTK
jgi:hypothetical protein